MKMLSDKPHQDKHKSHHEGQPIEWLKYGELPKQAYVYTNFHEFL